MKRYAVRIAAYLLVLCTVIAVFPALAPSLKADAAEVTLNYHSKTFWLSEVSGTHSGTTLSGGALTLASGSTSGTFTSGTLNIGAFSTMVASWNARTNGGKVSLAVQFELSGGSWSGWYSWGAWSSTRGVSASSSTSGTHASVSVDTLDVNSSYTATGNIKFRLTLTNSNGVPTVSNVSFATPQMAKQNTAGAYPSYYLNNVPMRSQLASANGSIGNIICSPTTTAMALEYMGTYVTSLTAAYDIYDNNWKAYGNWSFAVAYAGEKGYTAYLDYYDVAMAKYALSQGVVLGCSTTLTSSGHLVLLTGYDEANDQFIVNDPNVSESSIKVTRYSTSYFTARWLKSSTANLGLVYVFQKDRDLQSFNGQSPADYADGSLVKIKNVATGKYLTKSSDGNVAVSAATTAAEQVWKVSSVGNGKYSFINAANGAYLDVASAGTASGTNVQTYQSNGSVAQQFYLHKSGSYYNLRPSYTKSLLVAADTSSLNVLLASASASSTSQQYALESVSVTLPTDADYISLNAINASQYVSSVQVWTTGTFTAVYWGVLVLNSDGAGGYTVAQKYLSGQSKSVAASTDNIVVAIHQEWDSAMTAFDGVSVGDSVNLVGVYPGLGAMAQNAHLLLPAAFKLVNGSAFTLGTEYVTLSAPSTTVNTACAQFKCTVSTYTAKGVLMGGSEIVGTGCYVRRINSAGTVINSVLAVVKGDVTGDGIVTASDSIAMRGVLKSQGTFTGAFSEASDINGDGLMSTLDYVQMIGTLKG